MISRPKSDDIGVHIDGQKVFHFNMASKADDDADYFVSEIGILKFDIELVE